MPEAKPLSVLMVSSEDAFQAAGTSVALQTLFQGLKGKGHHPRILCRDKFTASPDSQKIKRNHRLESWLGRVTVRIGFNDLHAVSSFGIKKEEWYRQADVLHFHGLHGRYFNFMALPGLTQNKPAVWTLHDVWALTGHCSMFYDCERWKTGCGKCPYPDTHPAIKRDATHAEWLLKRRAYRRSKITLIIASDWMERRVKESMLGHLPVARIPYGIDLSAFRPLEPAACRQALGIPEGRKVLLFAAHDVMEPRKGWMTLVKALELLPDSLKKECVLLILGFKSDELAKKLPIDSIPLGFAGGNALKAMIYSAADLYLCPTRAETFGLTLIESMACGTPVAASDVGPVSELVQEGRTGYLFPIDDSKRMAERIVEAFSDPAAMEKMAGNGFALAQEYTIEKYVTRHEELYRSLVR